MFGKSNQKKHKSVQGDLTALLGKGVEFSGRLVFQGMVRIDGKFSGDITTDDTLIIGENGEVSAKMVAGSVVIMGSFCGDILARSNIEISSTGKLQGNIATPSLSVEPGAMFDGNCRMENIEEAKIEIEEVCGDAPCEKPRPS